MPIFIFLGSLLTEGYCMNIFTIKSKYLLLIAGVVWLWAGIMVTRTGLRLIPQTENMALILLGSVSVFLFFYLLIFSNLVYRHEYRIRRYDRERLPFWLFFDGKSYFFVVIMMGGGTLARQLGLIPHWLIAFFYPGIGIALFSCGIRFIVRYLAYEGGFKVISRLDKGLEREDNEK